MASDSKGMNCSIRAFRRLLFWIFSLVISVVVLLVWISGSSAAQQAHRATTTPGLISGVQTRAVPSTQPVSIPVDIPTAMPVPTPNLAEWIDQHFPESQELARRETAPDSRGMVERQILLQTHFKYPMIRVVEKIQSDPATAREIVITRTAMVADHMLLKLREGADQLSINALLQRFGGKSSKPLFRDSAQLVHFAQAGLDTVSDAVLSFSNQKQLVAYAEPDYLFFQNNLPNDPSFSSQWGLQNTNYPDLDISAVEGWNLHTSAASVLVAVIDSGVRYTHEDLAANMWHNPGEIPGNGLDDDGNGVIDDVHGADFYNQDADPNDDEGHGTHVAGIIGATGNNGLGVTGVCWQVQIMALKFLDANGTGAASDAVQAINYAVNQGAHLMNNSWGGDSFSQALQDAIANAGAHDIPFIAAAGNDARDTDVTKSYPACYDLNNIISVGSFSSSGSLSPFSNFGFTSVDILAPGASIYSPGNTSDTAYTTLSGTSQAAAFVSGSLALLKAEFPSESVPWLLKRLYDTTVPSPNFENRVRTDGRADLYNALAGIARVPVSIVTQPSAHPTYTGNNLTLSVVVQGGGPFRFQWYHNGEAMSGMTNSTLALTGLSSANNGSYYVVITNLTGMVTSNPVSVTVQASAPIFLTQPKGVTALTGQRVAFTADITGSLPLSYQWELNGVPIPGATSPLLVLPSIGSADAGEYCLAATNGNGSLRSSKAMLQIRHHYLESWTQVHPKPSQACYNNVAFVNNQFVAVGKAGAISTSVDGETWEACAAVTPSDLLAASYGNGRYVAVGTGGVILISTDAQTWEPVPSGVNQQISDVIYAAGRFVAVCGNYALVSTDGVNWSSKWIDNKSFLRVAYGAGTFVVLGDAADYNVYTSLSPDGSAWTASSPFASSSYNLIWASLVYADGLFWLGDGDKVFTSSSGVTWDFYKYLPGNKRLLPVQATLYMLDGYYYSWVNSYNPAKNWGSRQTLYNGGYNFASWQGLASGNGRIVVVGFASYLEDGGAILLSTDGISFKETSHFTKESLVGSTYGNGEFLAATRDGVIFSSPDGTNWTHRATLSLPLGTWFNAISYGNGRYVIASNITNSNGKVWVSSDGLSWTEYSYQANLSVSNADVVFLGGYFWLSTDSLGSLNHLNILRSLDGINWTPVTIPMNELAYGNGHWLRIYNFYGTFVSVSADASSWQETEIPLSYGVVATAASWGEWTIPHFDEQHPGADIPRWVVLDRA